MTPYFRPFAAATFALTLALPTAAPAQSFSPDQRGEIETIVREYLLKNPEVLQEVMNELEKRQAAAEVEKHRKAVSDNSALIFQSPRQVVLGNPKGDVTMVELFDYNCAYCKRAHADMKKLIENDKNLRVVLKEFPVLGEGSMTAAQVAAAVSLVAPERYGEFHEKLLT